jgi:pimeloyl-ACP methyl ester carboxylesterase
MERQSVDIGAGISLEAVVARDGPVTVVFENGLGTPLEEWDAVAPHVAQRTRTLRYDRRSAVPSGPVGTRTAADMAADLERLLATLGLESPYVLTMGTRPPDCARRGRRHSAFAGRAASRQP